MSWVAQIPSNWLLATLLNLPLTTIPPYLLLATTCTTEELHVEHFISAGTAKMGLIFIVKSFKERKTVICDLIKKLHKKSSKKKKHGMFKHSNCICVVLQGSEERWWSCFLLVFVIWVYFYCSSSPLVLCYMCF